LLADFLSLPLVGQDIYFIEASRSLSDTPHSVGVLWTSDQSDADAASRQHTTLTRDIRVPGEIGTHNPMKGAAPDTRLTPRGYREQLLVDLTAMCLSYSLNTSDLLWKVHPTKNTT